MTKPEVTIGFQDGGLGLIAPGARLVALFGLCSLAADNSINLLTSKNQVSGVLGFGELAEAAAYHLAISGQPVLAIPVNQSVNAAYSAVTKVGSSTSILSVAGNNALDDHDVLVELTAAGANLGANTAAFKLSLDGGETFSEEIAVPVSGIFAIPNTGMTITFAAGTFVVGTTYTFTATAGSFALGDVTAAVDALIANSRVGSVEFLHIVGATDATFAAALDAYLESTATDDHLYLWALLSTVDKGADTEADWADDLIADFDGFEGNRVAVAAGYAQLLDPKGGHLKFRSAAWPYAARLASISLSTNPIQFDGGALKGVLALRYDENASGLLDDARFVTLRTFDGENGFFVTNGNTMAAADSDFSDVPRRRVMDAAARQCRKTLLRTVLGQTLPVNKVTGFIDEATARSLDGEIEADIKTAIGAEIVSVEAQVSRTENILSTERLPVEIEIVPFAYAKSVTVTLAYVNPSLTPT
jgi:hypothetical protein